MVDQIMAHGMVILDLFSHRTITNYMMTSSHQNHRTSPVYKSKHQIIHCIASRLIGLLLLHLAEKSYCTYFLMANMTRKFTTDNSIFRYF